MFFWPNFYLFLVVADVFGYRWADGVVMEMVVGSMIVMVRFLGEFFVLKVDVLGWDGVEVLRHSEQENKSYLVFGKDPIKS